MQVQGNGVLYKNQYGWSISDDQKNIDGTISKYFIPVKLKKDLPEPEDKSRVSIKGFTKPYKTKEGKLGISYFIMDYQVSEGSKTVKNDIIQSEEPKKDVVSEQFAEFAQEIELDDDSLPF